MERRLDKVLRAGQAHVAKCRDDEEAAHSATDLVFHGNDLNIASLILAAIGQGENQNKLAACQAAQNWCVSQSRKNGYNPCKDEKLSLGWTDLAKRVFGTTGLIYDAWNVPSNPKENFYSLCYATGLADAVSKYFILKMIPKIRKHWKTCFQESWDDGSYEAEGMFGFTTPRTYEETLERDYPIIKNTKQWEHHANWLYNNSPSKNAFEMLYEENHQQSYFISTHEFRPMLDALVVGTSTLLLERGILQDFDSQCQYSEDEIGQEASRRQEARLYRVASELSIHAVSIWGNSKTLNNNLSREERDKITHAVLKEQRVAFLSIVENALSDSPSILNDVPINTNDDFWPSQINSNVPWSLGTDIEPMTP